MTIRMTATRSALLAAFLSASLVLPGCYKAEAEKEKTRANTAEEKLKGLEAELSKAKSDIQAAAMRAQQAEAQFRTISSGATLVTMVDGQPIGTDTIRFNGSSFVRHGERRRSNGSVQFDNGRLADGAFTMNRDNGKKWFEGAVRMSRPEGEWIWYDRADKVQARTSRWTRLDDRQVEIRWPDLVRKVEHYIKKRRELWDFEGVRIHLDSVAGLGNFLEFEGVVDSSGDPTRVRGTVEHLIGQFRPVLGEPVSGSYADM
jgi:outer membrane murein-binding lipoprotein Lpp